MTPGCVQAAADILSNMDHSVNPCEDFYQFACGGFIEKTVIPDDRTRMSSFSVLSDELLTQVGLYIICMYCMDFKCTFWSTHIALQSSCGLCFWVPDPLMDIFY